MFSFGNLAKVHWLFPELLSFSPLFIRLKLIKELLGKILLLKVLEVLTCLLIRLFFFCFSKHRLFSQNYSAVFLLIHSMRWTELLNWLLLIYLESGQISFSKSFDSRSWFIRRQILSSELCVHTQIDSYQIISLSDSW